MHPEALWRHLCKIRIMDFSTAVRRVERHINTTYVESKAAGEPQFKLGLNMKLCDTPSGTLITFGDLPNGVATSIITNAMSNVRVVNCHVDDHWVVYVK
jgi:hypothetical protein